jgi:LmbE family N-acetylglucosaminyl deacetylase
MRPGGAAAQGVNATAGQAILQDLRTFRTTGTVLYVGAHPDDENTQMIAYLSRGRALRTAYLSMTRGDGGQNLLGPELGEKLGVARTQELLAARRVDGGRQFFTRAIDFGFSKDYKEALKTWGEQDVLSDVVRVIREFRPDVVITRFSIVPGNTHGHHTASAVLANEAFKIVGDPTKFPDQLKTLSVWQPKRIFMNSGATGGNGQSGAPASASVIRMDIGGKDPVTGEAFSSIAARSRGQHKTQGFGGAQAGGDGPRPETLVELDGAPASQDILDGVDTTWARVPAGAAIGTMADAIVAKFNTQDPAASVPDILALRAKLAALQSTDPVVADKRQLLDRILQHCLGLTVETDVPQAEVVPGEAMKLHHVVTESSSVPVKWTAVRYPSVKQDLAETIALKPGQASARDTSPTLPTGTPVSQPYWLREDGTPGLFKVSDPSLIGRPENPPAFPVEDVFDVGGQTLVVSDEPIQAGTGGTPESRRKLEVIPPASLNFTGDIRIFAPGGSKTVEVDVTASRPNVSGTVSLDAPAGWTVTPVSQPFTIAAVGSHAPFTFKVTAPSKTISTPLRAHVTVGGAKFNSGRYDIHYPHIPLQVLQSAVKEHGVSVNLTIRGTRVAYLPGAGDDVGQILKEMGYDVKEITGADLTADSLKNFDAVVLGIRVFNVRNDVAANMPALFAYAENGGTVVVQYNQPSPLSTRQIAPWPLTISQDRVTDENAEMTYLAPTNPVLSTPNKITDADFDGWVQERGLYFPNQWDEHFTPILVSNDPGEGALKGSLLVAKDGKGYYVYTGLAFFRQLPAGNPGAIRLFANLVSLGK